MKSNVEGFTNKTIINHEAAEWVLLLEDTPELSQKQIEDLNTWVATSDIHRECIESMANSWGEMDILSSVMLPQEMRQESISPSILLTLFAPVVALYSLITDYVKHSKTLLRPAVVMPVLLCTLMGGVVHISQLTSESQGLVFTTKIGEKLSHTMSDGSIIWLNSSTKIQVDYSTDYRRINLLNGEAHFEVAKDSSRPFEVYANDRLIRAIGTAFSVHKLNGKIEVLVSEGTVELAIVDNSLVVIPDDFQPLKIKENFIQKNNEGNVRYTEPETLNQKTNVKKILGKLTAGQRISIPIKDEDLSDIDELDNSEITRFLSWKEGKLVFAGESLEEVIQEITRHTKVQIDVLDPQLKSMRIGGQFQVGETDTLFYVLESGFGISVNKLTENHVQLSVKK